MAYERGEEEIAKTLGCNWIVYQDCDDLKELVKSSTSLSLPLSCKCLKLYVVRWIEKAIELDCVNCLVTGLINRFIFQILLLSPLRLSESY